MLKQHTKTVHEGLNDYDCEYCDRSFTNSWSLKNHIIKIHEGRKDHKCDRCGKDFMTEKSLQNHISYVHEGKRNIKKYYVYNCDICGKDFKNFGNLKKHIKSAHEDQKTALKDLNSDLKFGAYDIEIKEENIGELERIEENVTKLNEDHLNINSEDNIKTEDLNNEFDMCDIEIKDENIGESEQIEENEDPLNINSQDFIKTEFNIFNPENINMNLSEPIEFIDQDDIKDTIH